MSKLINSLATICWVVEELNKMKWISKSGVAIFIYDEHVLEPADYNMIHQRILSFELHDQQLLRPKAVNVIFTHSIERLWNLTQEDGFFKRSCSYIYVTVFSGIEIDAFLRKVWDRYKIPGSLAIHIESANFYSYNPLLNFTNIQAGDQFNSDFLRATPNLHGVGAFRVVYFQREESFVVDEELNIIGGQDALVMKTLAEHFNTKLELVETSDGKRYGQRAPNGTIQGTFTNILQDSAEITGNTHFLKYYDVEGLDFTHHMGVDRLCLLVPKAKRIPNYVAMYRNVHYRWLFVYVASCMLGLTLTRGIEKLLKTGHKNIGINITAIISVAYRIFLGVPFLYRFDKVHEKIVVSSFLLATVVISNYFQGMMTTIANRPWYEKTMNTLSQVRDKGIPIIYSSQEVKSYLVNDDLHGMNFIEVSVEESKAASSRNDVGRTHRIYSVFTKRNMYYKGMKAKISMQIMPECLVDYPLAFVVPAGSPLLVPINWVLSQLVESGLYLKWTKDSVPPNSYTEKKARKDEKSSVPDSVRNEELYYAYVILGVGQAISSLIFLAEHVLHNRNLQSKSGDDVNFTERYRYLP